MSVGAGIDQIVDRDDFEGVRMPLQDRAKGKSSDTPKAVDTNFD
jgi:hypothetical protein